MVANEMAVYATRSRSQLSQQGSVTNMQAVRIHNTGGTDVLSLEDSPRPEVGDGQILIKVHAASVNPVDYKIRSGSFKSGKTELPLTLGRDVSGVVQETARGVEDVSEGDEVYAMLGAHGGGYAEFALADEDEVAPKPRSLDHVHAAAVPLAALTAWQGLFDHGGLISGERVLIHGAGGGVGHFAAQFARIKGADVTVTVAPEDFDFMSDLGIEKIIDFRAGSFEDSTKGIDLVLDLVAGEAQEHSWSVLKRGGRLVSALGEPPLEKAEAHGVVGKGFFAKPDARQLREIGSMIDAGDIKVRVTRTLPLSEVREAHEQLESEHSQGKTVLTVA